MKEHKNVAWVVWVVICFSLIAGHVWIVSNRLGRFEARYNLLVETLKLVYVVETTETLTKTIPAHYIIKSKDDQARKDGDTFSLRLIPGMGWQEIKISSLGGGEYFVKDGETYVECGVDDECWVAIKKDSIGWYELHSNQPDTVRFEYGYSIPFGVDSTTID